MRRLALLLVVPVLALSACATEAEVREACEDHNGVNAVSGNKVRKNVACRDGWFEVVK